MAQPVFRFRKKKSSSFVLALCCSHHTIALIAGLSDFSLSLLGAAVRIYREVHNFCHIFLYVAINGRIASKDISMFDFKALEKEKSTSLLSS